MDSPQSPRIAVLLPCYNEEAAIGATVRGFRAALPSATVYVYDNNSRDGTRAVAAKAGAVVRSERQQGKGNVVRRMFADVDADIYVMADGDLTYDPQSAPVMVDILLAEQLDMVVGTRRHDAKGAYRGGHVFGNRLFTGLLSGLFGRSFTDIFSGYRVFSRRFVKSFPVLSSGFEIETEMSVHALELRMPVGEVETAYAARPEGSRVQAFDLLRRFADPEDHCHFVSHRTPGPVLREPWRASARRGDRPRDPTGHHVPAHRTGAALPDGNPGHGHDRDRSAVLLHRASFSTPSPAAGARFGVWLICRWPPLGRCSLFASPRGDCVACVTVLAT